jgi:hypothetical protein
MAGANLPAKKYKKTSPTVTRLSFEFDGGSTEFIDIAQALSAINRKFYRQGVYYYVNSVEIYNDETGVVDLHTVPDNWVTKNAWNRGFKLFQKMNSMADQPLTSVGRPKYHDFKVYMDYRHALQASSVPPSLYTINAGSTTIVSDDWVISNFVSADSDGDTTTDSQGNTILYQEADDFTTHLVGGHLGTSDDWDSIGLIRSYSESRRTIQATQNSGSTANVASNDPMMNIFDMSSEEQLNDIVDNLMTDNDAPPYNYNLYVGEENTNLQHVARIGTETGVGRVGRAAGFCAPFGLICVDPSGVSTAFRVVLNLAVGTYHGVYAERA